jgi:hypothetical protein
MDQITTHVTDSLVANFKAFLARSKFVSSSKSRINGSSAEQQSSCHTRHKQSEYSSSFVAMYGWKFHRLTGRRTSHHGTATQARRDGSGLCLRGAVREGKNDGKSARTTYEADRFLDLQGGISDGSSSSAPADCVTQPGSPRPGSARWAGAGLPLNPPFNPTSRTRHRHPRILEKGSVHDNSDSSTPFTQQHVTSSASYCSASCSSASYSAMGILALPPELLRQVADDLLPVGIEAFCLSCKTLYDASFKPRQYHNVLKRKYRNVVIKDWTAEDKGDDSNISCILQLLADVAECPLIALYIETADLNDDCWTNSPDFKREWGELREKVDILELVERCEYLREAGIDSQDWRDQILTEYAEPHPISSAHTLALLLAQLPNLRACTLPQYLGGSVSIAPGSDPNVWKLYDFIVRKANEAIATGTEASLARLESIRPSGSPYETGKGMMNLAPFMSIASVTEVKENCCVAAGDESVAIGMPFWPKYDTFGANLQIMELVACGIGGEKMRIVLGNCTSLRTLKISSSESFCHRWNAGDFVAAICESPAAQTLEVLSLSIYDGRGLMVTGVRDLKALTSLKALEFDVGLLDGPPYSEYCTWKSVGESELARFYSSSPPEILPLRDFLPKPVARLTMLGLLTKETSL